MCELLVFLFDIKYSIRSDKSGLIFVEVNFGLLNMERVVFGKKNQIKWFWKMIQELIEIETVCVWEIFLTQSFFMFSYYQDGLEILKTSRIDLCATKAHVQ